ncbi:hypothetical protein JAAARDRAFT_37997 [Jaapia argillacea MUCL 33604]|uniref:Tricalbin n=1 Tax=Jaapia argillacea MUCL 33604 TaxID=933084 RepID=A0A067PM12_9AGAM|nr:hypothetical protein JAAARDRAFT_37997 [Jaapia argillacea MUCL 33604]
MASNGLAPPSQEAQAQVNGIVQRDAAQGSVPVHTFDPNSTPQEKAAAAGKARDQLKPISQKDPKATAGGQEVAIDTGTTMVTPTITIEDVDKDPDPTTTSTQPQPALPGGLPQSQTPVVPGWYKVGWRAVGGVDVPQLAEGEEKDKTVLDAFLSEQFYGEWYHNAGLIVVAVLVTHFMTRFNFGWGWLFIVLAFCSTYYTTSVSRFRRRARDDIQRELVKTTTTVEESAEWLNNFLDRFWQIYEPVLSATIIASVDQILSANTPAFLDSLRLTTFTLGSKAPRIDKVHTWPKTADDVVQMDWAVSFTPHDESDMTKRQIKTKVNPKIVLSIRVGKGLATASIPVLLEDITFSGLMRIKMKLMTNFPHVQIVDICFLEKPVIEYALKPIGGDTFGLDIAGIPGLSEFIREMTHSTLQPMMYFPNVFTLNLEQMLSGVPLDAAIGVLQITVHSARGIKGTKLGGGTPDPYVTLSYNNRAQLAKTKYKHNTYNPTWNETKFLLVNTLGEQLTFNVFDYNEHRKDAEMGAATFDLSKLQDDAIMEGVEAPILKDGKDRGSLRFDVSFYPVLKSEAPDGGDLPDTDVGIVRITLHQAKELDTSKSMTKDLNPFAKVFLGDNPKSIFATPKFKHTLSPVWESATEFLCSEKKSSVITIKVIDDRDFMADPVVGYLSIRLADLLEAKKDAGKDWWPLSGCKSGKLRMSADWKPLNMAGSLHGAGSYVPPIGVVRLWLQKATDVKNVEAALGGKSDPYVRVQLNNVTLARTEVINNNLNPVWDQIIYVPVHSLKEVLLLECMDYQNLTKDRSLGSVDLRIADLAISSTANPPYSYESTGKREVADPIRLDRGNAFKGQLHYVAEFIPSLPVQGVKFDATPNEMQKRVENDADSGDDDGSIASDKSSDKEASEDVGERIPQGVTVSAPLGAEPKPSHAKNAKSTDTTNTTETTDTTHTADSAKTAATQSTAPANGKEPNGKAAAPETVVKMSKEELLKEQSGIIVFNVISGTLAKKGRLEVLLDEGYWPSFSTARSRSTHAQWDHVGEGFVKELDFSRVWLRLNEANEWEKDDVVAEWKGDAKKFLEQTLDGPTKFTLMDENERSTSVVEIEARYVPVHVTLEPRESVNNQGVLQVTLIDGYDIQGVDRGGKSDPFAVFTLNGQRAWKSQTKKKTLTPEWNETFSLQVPSRVGADFKLEVFDWNQIEQAKLLGTGKIELADVEPFVGVERAIPLTSDKHGEKGVVRVRLNFQPEIIAKTRKNTSTFSSAGRAMTQIGHMPVGAGKGVISGVRGVFAKDHGKGNGNGNGHGTIAEEPSLGTAPGQSSEPVGPVAGVDGAPATGVSTFPSNASMASLDSNKNEPGTLRVTIIDAKDLHSPGDTPKPYATIRVGDKEQKTKHTAKTISPEWNESFVFSAGPTTAKLYIWVHDHKTLGKDKLIASGEVDIWRHIQPTGQTAAEVKSELREGGLLRLRIEYDSEAMPTSSSRKSIAPSQGEANRASSFASPSFTSPSRFSIRSKRPGSDE